MIKQKTVFILGAGASQPYGYPTGNDLIQELINLENDPLFFRHLSLAFPVFFPRDSKAKEEFSLLIEKFKGSGLLSIDEYFSGDDGKGGGRSSELVAIAKFAIAYVLKNSGLRNPYYYAKAGDWYRHLYNKYLLNEAKTFEDFQANTVSFITFNYDLSLENFFKNAISSKFEKKVDKVSFDYNPIFHVHGKLETDKAYRSGLGDLQRIQLDINDANDPEAAKARFVLEESKGIKFVSDFEDGNETVGKIRLLLASAHRVFFLGFGYHPTNVKALDINWRNEFVVGGSRVSTRYFGTCFGFKGTEDKRLKTDLTLASKSGHCNLTLFNCDCLELLQENAIHLI